MCHRYVLRSVSVAQNVIVRINHSPVDFDVKYLVARVVVVKLREVKADVPVAKIDSAARKVLKQHKLDKAFVHSTGHGLGLEIHEAPRLAQKEKAKLKAGMVITIEPGVYLEGLGGIRIEDTILVTENGCQIMTPTSKEFVHL